MKDIETESRYTEEQILESLKESEAGLETPELCRKHGMSEQTFYRWKAKYGGLEVSGAQRLTLESLLCAATKSTPSELVAQVKPISSAKDANP